MHRIALPEWAVARGRPVHALSQLDPARTAFVGIDMQCAFTSAGQVFANPHALDILDNVNRLARACRVAGGSVWWTRQTVDDHDPRHADPHWLRLAGDASVATAKAALRAGSDGHALHPGIKVRPGDAVIDKFRYSAFLPGFCDLHTRLQETGVDTLVIAGTLTNCCCESSARDAFMLGYRVLFAADATAAVSDEEHNAALLNLAVMFADVRRTDDIVALLAR
ncbi:isochorismatase family protein [Pseudoxanthomonas spadix]|uniref:isochorismatase family protein n=1 Tax=Pseudoxanthomonas spadix TaxID=415229 RepID=UPI000F001B1B|nr:cysteine hydrolase [Pseudoxanthomonas spadix]MBP3974366.1 cysteine hydrolase [Pseudoxanthomonas spadix]RMW97443.1 cysteine hydrolase [Pseudoxanthomonas spadix]